MIDLDAIKTRVRNAYLLDRDDGDALERAMGDVTMLVAEVERLSAEVKAERAAVVAWLRNEYDTDSARTAADEIERGEHRREEKP